MSDYQKGVDVAGIERPLILKEATPPRHPTPMPRQVITFWTPRLLFVEAVHAIRMRASGLSRQPIRATEHATLSLPHGDDGR